ncbi:MAG: hypothetical protein HQL70_05355 [Magnetococcales bacterium]|nr:hypothetical protein [Magnetococcales bacterium]
MSLSTKLPFFIIIDDGAFPKVHGNRGELIPFSAYETILRLAETFNMRIPICFTMGYMDLGRRSSQTTPLPYAEKLIKFIKRNEHRIEFGEHGLYHRFKETTYEYYNPDTDDGPSEIEQQQKIKIIGDIFKDIGRPFPTLQVPPAHGWQPGVTDRLYAQAGIRDTVSYRWKKYTLSLQDLTNPKRLYKGLSSYAYIWPDSEYTNFFPRASMGIIASDYNPHGSLFTEKVKRYIQPSAYPYRRLLHRAKNQFAVHSYMTHIANFAGPDAFDFWSGLFRWVENSDHLVLAHDNEEAKSFYLALPGSLKPFSGQNQANEDVS